MNTESALVRERQKTAGSKRNVALFYYHFFQQGIARIE